MKFKTSKKNKIWDLSDLTNQKWGLSIIWSIPSFYGTGKIECRRKLARQEWKLPRSCDWTEPFFHFFSTINPCGNGFVTMRQPQLAQDRRGPPPGVQVGHGQLTQMHLTAEDRAIHPQSIPSSQMKSCESVWNINPKFKKKTYGLNTTAKPCEDVSASQLQMNFQGAPKRWLPWIRLFFFLVLGAQTWTKMSKLDWSNHRKDWKDVWFFPLHCSLLTVN